MTDSTPVMTLPPPAVALTPISHTAEPGQQVLLDAVSWTMYLRLLRIFDERHIRLTYDQGMLEIMTLTQEHERYKHLLNRLICALADELEIPVAGYGSWTLKQRKSEKGMEPDECYWIQSEPLIRFKTKIDLRRDPPPDLVVEIEVSHSLLDRLSILAALRVPEVWRYDGETLRVMLRDEAGRYVESEQSRAFPSIPPAELARFLALRASLSEIEMVRQFRAWIREHVQAT